MPGVRSRDGESFDQLLKRFKKQCEKAGVLADLRKKEHFEKPSVKKKKKTIAAQKRIMKKIKRQVRK